MCKFCEKYRHQLTGDVIVDPILENAAGDMVCIVGPTPISKRKHEGDGLTAELQISLSPQMNSSFHSELLYIPIKYCPICGRDLSK